MQEFFGNKVVPIIMKFVSLKGVVALKDGLLYTMPLSIVGSVFLLLANFPVQAVVDWLSSMGWMDPLNQAYGATFNISALVAVVGIAYEYVKKEGYQALNAGVLGFVVFLITTNSFVVAESGEVVSNVIDKTWTAGQGMITAIVIGLIVGWVYSWFMKHDIRIKMPAGVPEGVANSFTALIPAFAIITGATLVYSFFKFVLDTTFIEAVYTVIQTPLQGMTDSLGGVIMMTFLTPFLWWFGVHGSTIVGGIMGPLLGANALANQAILDSGMALTIENGGHIVTGQFIDQFITVTGAGLTIGLVTYMIFFAKSKQCKELGKLGGVPGIFNINEPILFGTPIVMNPFLALPFIGMPVLSGIITYFALATGLVPLFSAITVPWTTPPIVSGFIIGGWRAALLQAVILVLSFFAYLPFIRKIDKMNFEAEKAAK
ncbi:MAG: PTS sugar transporter subunit IIC [Turicibacter sp.]|nr:PTS sugar transporter subunit IIC [Turicibacter sp.]